VRPDPKLISVVVPFFREGSVVDRFFAVTLPILRDLGSFELIAVDDGSDDDTFERLRGLAAREAGVRVLRLSRNYGHQVALSAGLDHARGDVVVLMDGDLQDPPELIRELIARWREGLDVVYAVRKRRTGEAWPKRVTARVFYRVLRTLSDQEIPLDTGDFRLIDRRVLEALRRHPERDRFLRGLIASIGFAQGPVYFERPRRAGGEAKYTLRKLAGLAAAGIFSFSRRPLQLATWLGLTVSGFAALYLLWVLGRALWAPEARITGWASTLCTLLFLGGVQLICLGVVGEYVGRIYDEVKRRPLYLVRDAIGLHAPPAAGPDALD
jgi:dolichol-phosphate mannosyltransferase